MRILIIRHAEPDYKNNTLTEKGFREADMLGRYLKDEKIDKIFVSCLPRALYTADGITRYNNTKTYEVCDWLREMDPRIDLPYDTQRLSWDLAPTYLNAEDKLYDKDEWKRVKSMDNANLQARVSELDEKLNETLKKFGYEKNGKTFKAIEPNHLTLAFVCHFGAESYMLANLLNVSPVALSNHTCARPSSVTTLYTEERERGEAIFRMIEFGSVNHLYVFGEKPSFMARFDEVYGDGNEEYKKVINLKK